MVVQGEIGLTGVRVGDTWILELSKDLNSGTWHEVVSNASPSPRSRNTLTYIRVNQVVLFGGRGLGYDVLNDVWLLDIQEQLNDILQILYDFQDLAGSCSLPRVVHSATLILGGRILVYGGEDTFRHRKDDFWALDIKTIPSTCLLHPEDAAAVSLNGSKAWKRLDVTDQKACPFIVPALIVQDGVPDKSDQFKQLDVTKWLTTALGPLKGRCGKGKGGLASGQGTDASQVQAAFDMAASFASMKLN